MADKEQWEIGEWAKDGHKILGYEILQRRRNKRTIIIGYIFDEADASEIVALHNSAISINPSNPMAVAEGMEEALDAMSDLVAYCTGYIKKDAKHGLKLTKQALDALATITKPATEKGEVK